MKNKHYENLYTGLVVNSKSVLQFSKKEDYQAFLGWINLPVNESKKYGFQKALKENRIKYPQK